MFLKFFPPNFFSLRFIISINKTEFGIAYNQTFTIAGQVQANVETVLSSAFHVASRYSGFDSAFLHFRNITSQHVPLSNFLCI